MAVRRGAHAELDDPDMGHLVVDARRHDGQVDVSVGAQRANSAETLRGLQPELASYLRHADVPLGNLSVGVSGDRGASGTGTSGQQASDNHPRGEGEPAHDQTGDSPTPQPKPGRRVRFVL
jgi:hypothetical protein